MSEVFEMEVSLYIQLRYDVKMDGATKEERFNAVISLMEKEIANKSIQDFDYDVVVLDTDGNELIV